MRGGARHDTGVNRLRAVIVGACLAVNPATDVACVTCAGAQRAPAPADSAILRGTVTSRESGRPLPYAIVAIPSAGLQRFANDQGRFAFTGLPAGTYRLRVRQLGHSPVELDVTLSPGGVQDVAVALARIATRIDAMRVSADWECHAPGRPTGNAMALAVMEQMDQNAERLRLLADEYPFEISTQRRFMLRQANGADSVERVDTILVASGARTRYRPGQVVADVQTGRRRESILQVPTLLDFADSLFQRNHCFVVRGVDDSTGVPLLRVDFKAWSRLRTPDVDGSVFLDSATFALRRSEIRLTRIPRGFAGLVGVHVTTRFIDLQPGLPVPGPIFAVNRFRDSRGPRAIMAAVEEQVPLDVRFLRARPDSLPH